MPKRYSGFKPVRVIWSAMHSGGLNEAYFHTVIDRAAGEGVSGVEICGHGMDRYISYRAFPELAQGVDADGLKKNQDTLRRLAEHAAAKGLRFGLWHHEIDGPANLLTTLPALRASDGLIDLDSPELYRFIREKAGEFFTLFPSMDEIVLTLTETAYPVLRRPCDIPVAERVRRLLQALADVLDPLGKTLVIRPSSARADEIHVREAVEKLQAKHVALMYKTEPHDWHPFLPNEELIGSIAKYEVRAETDAGAEYYGQTIFPCSFTGHLDYRLLPAIEKGATAAVLRVDRGAVHASLGHPVNEVNVIAPTRWCRSGKKPMAHFWREWCRERHGAESKKLYEILERSFEVVKKSLYIDQQAITHNLFPDLRRARYIQAFLLFEENVPLGHLRRNWGMIADRCSLTHEQMLAEKQEALAIALKIVGDFEKASADMARETRQAVLASLRNLPILAGACLAFCRVSIAHLEEAWRRPRRTTGSFEVESRLMLEMADRIERDKGPKFWLHMVPRMRDLVRDLEAERAVELPLRQQLEANPDILDCVLCGFVSEGHRFSKMLHSGKVTECHARIVRVTGKGPEQDVTYQLKAPQGLAKKVVVTLAGDDGHDAAGIVRINGMEHPIAPGPLSGLHELAFDAPETSEVDVSIWSTTPKPVWVAQIALMR